MINLRDLHKGNIVSDYEGNIITISSISDCVGCLENNNRYTPAGIYGIPLRFSILILCFGFEYSEYADNREFVFIKKDNDIVIGLKKHGVFVYVSNTFLAHIFYVHELENILSFIMKQETELLTSNLKLCHSLL